MNHPPDDASGCSVPAYNRAAWDRQVASGNRWTIPVDAATVEQARRGTLQLLLTPSQFVPQSWYPPLTDADVLCLASGGGQQAPLLAATGARVTSLDNSPRQLEQDELVARREQLALRTILGGMHDLSVLADASFDLVFHPCSNCFVADILPVWRECFRVLRPGGVLLAGFSNPLRYLFDLDLMAAGQLQVRYAIPYSDVASLDDDQRRRHVIEPGHALEFGHSLADQIGGQLQAGFVMTGFFEDRYPDTEPDPISRYTASFLATRALKPV